jgi:hypothetical protein
VGDQRPSRCACDGAFMSGHWKNATSDQGENSARETVICPLARSAKCHDKRNSPGNAGLRVETHTGPAFQECVAGAPGFEADASNVLISLMTIDIASVSMVTCYVGVLRTTSRPEAS